MSGNTMEINTLNTTKVNLMRNVILAVILAVVSACNFGNPDKAVRTAQYTVQAAAKEAYREARTALRDAQTKQLNDTAQVLLKIEIANAVKDYQDVVAQVEKFNEDSKLKAYAKLDVELFVEEMRVFVAGKCSAWKWKGKVWSIKHCVTHTKEQRAADPVAELKKTTLEADFYEEGLESSPDVRWWGGTTNRWITIPMEQIFRFTLNDDVPLMQKFSVIGAYGNAESALRAYNSAVEDKKPTEEKKEAAKKAFITYHKWVNYIKSTYIAQEYLCSSSFHRDAAKGGDSGGPLMLGDEVIGSVSYEVHTRHPEFDGNYGAFALSNYPVSCFSAIDAPTKKLDYVTDLEVEYTKVLNNYTDVFGIIEVLGWTHE